MKPLDILKHEHQVILLVIGAIEREADEIGSTGKVDGARVLKMVDFVRNFADRCHHAKEEDILFVRMKEKGMPADEGPVFVMLKEHEEGRKYIAEVVDALPGAEAADKAAAEIVRDNLLAYAGLLKAHIQKEDNILYPIADKMLGPEDQKRLAEDFERIEREELGEGVHERYHELAHELAREHQHR